MSGATVKVNEVTAVVTGGTFKATGVALAAGDDQAHGQRGLGHGRPSDVTRRHRDARQRGRRACS